MDEAGNSIVTVCKGIQVMGAEVPVWVYVEKPRYEWIRVSAVTLDQAIEIAERLPDVRRVLEASYIPGGVVT